MTSFSCPSGLSCLRVGYTLFPKSSHCVHSLAPQNPGLGHRCAGLTEKCRSTFWILHARSPIQTFLLQVSVLWTQLATPAFLRRALQLLHMPSLVFSSSPEASSRFCSNFSSCVFRSIRRFLRMLTSPDLTYLFLPISSHPRAILSISHWCLYR